MIIYAKKRPAMILAALESAGEPLTTIQIAGLIGARTSLVSDALCDLDNKFLVTVDRRSKPFLYATPARCLDLPPPTERRTLVALI